jgi:hypothetical protein
LNTFYIMRTLLRSRFVSVALLVGLPVVASAHPGHGDHDFTWEISHFAAHPFATAGCAAVLGAVAVIVWQVSRAKSERGVRRGTGR